MQEINIDTPEGMKQAVEWQTDFISILNEGGKWAVPRSNAIYTIHHSEKTVERAVGDSDVDRVFEAMGWKVIKVKKEED
jgi:cyanophycinase-like exopeptidase